MNRVREMMDQYSIGPTELAEASDVSIGLVKAAKNGTKTIHRAKSMRKLTHGLNSFIPSGVPRLTVADIFSGYVGPDNGDGADQIGQG